MLNLVRAAAAQMVVVGHASSFVVKSTPVGYLASLGVVIFFLISGYLIAGSAQRSFNKGAGFSDYFINRFARIYSTFIPALIVIALTDWLFVSLYGWSEHANSQTISIKHFFANTLMLQNAPAMNKFMNWAPFGSSQFGSGRPLWTLSFEWWLYMSFGMIYFMRGKIFDLKWLGLFGICAYVPISNMMSLSTYAGGLTMVWVIGTVLWFSRPYWKFIKAEWALLICIWAGLVATLDLLIPIASSRPVNIYDLKFMIVLSISLSALIVWERNKNSQNSNIISHTFKYISDYSYTLYLIHYSLIYLIINTFNDTPKLTLIVICIIISNVAALLIASLTESNHKQFAFFLKRSFGITK